MKLHKLTFSREKPRRENNTAVRTSLDRRDHWLGWLFCAMIGIGLFSDTMAGAADLASKLQIRETKSGVRFGLWGNPADAPAPTLFILGNTIEGTLGDAYFRQCGNVLAKQGYLCVSIDLPCHGAEQRADEPAGLEGWRHRADQGEDFVEETNQRLTEVLDDLIDTGMTDPARVAACGTSRGGFIAMHFATADPRVKCVASYAPVTNLTALREFHGAEDNALVASLALEKQADKLGARAIWIIIGDRDTRVSTDDAITLARKITTSALAQGLPAAVELHVVPEPKGHTTPAGAPEQSADWIDRQINNTHPHSSGS